MYTAKSPQAPAERNIDVRVRVLGVVAFLLLAGAFFSVGVFCIGPRLRSARNAAPPEQTSHYVQPQERRQPADEEQPKSQGPDIKLEVTEQEAGDVPAADEPAADDQSQTRDVNAAGNELTITLGDKDKHSSDRGDDRRIPSAAETRRPSARSNSKVMSPGKVSPVKPGGDEPKERGATRSSTDSKLERPRAATETRSIIYRVQAGTYSSRSTADSLATKLKSDGYRRARVTEVQSRGRTLYRVQVAEYRTAEDAQELSKDLRSTGYSPAVVPDEKSR